MANALVALERENQSLSARWRSAREKAKAETGKLVDAALTSGSAFGFGYAQGRYPDKFQLGGAPLSLVIGGGLVVASVMGLMPKSAQDYGDAVGVGGLAAYAAIKGLQSGQDAAKKA